MGKSFNYLCILTVLIIASHSAPTEAMEDGRNAAKAMAIKASELIKTKGKKSAFTVFEQKGGEFQNKALYVFVLNLSGVVLSHGADKKLIGKNLSKIKDQNGKKFVQEFIEVAKSKGVGWVDYVWPHPVTKKDAPKSSFIIGVGKNLLVGVGAYN